MEDPGCYHQDKIFDPMEDPGCLYKRKKEVSGGFKTLLSEKQTNKSKNRGSLTENFGDRKGWERKSYNLHCEVDDHQTFWMRIPIRHALPRDKKNHYATALYMNKTIYSLILRQKFLLGCTSGNGGWNDKISLTVLASIWELATPPYITPVQQHICNTISRHENKECISFS